MSTLLSRSDRRAKQDALGGVAGEHGDEEETVEVERALFEQRRRTRRRRRLRPYVIALLVLLLAGGATYALWFSGLLGAERTVVTGTSYLAPVQVREAARVPLGGPLAKVDLEAIRARLTALPAVKSAKVTRDWPHTVRIAVTERVAVAVVPQSGGGYRGLAADGMLFRHYDGRPRRLPVVRDEKGADAEARREAALVVGSLPAGVLGKVDHVSVGTVDQIELMMRSGRRVVWGDSSASADKAAVLDALLKRRSSVIDVSVPGRPTTRP